MIHEIHWVIIRIEIHVTCLYLSSKNTKTKYAWYNYYLKSLNCYNTFIVLKEEIIISNLELPMYPESEYIGDLGVRTVESIVCDEIGLIFRRQEKNDLGIDAHIEYLQEDRKGTGRLIAIQIKCGASFFKEQNDEGFIYRGELKHYHYWINHSLPVILIICHPITKDSYWVHITKANTTLLSKSWRITIPFNHRLDAESKYELKRIADQLQHGDMAELALFKFLHEKYENRIKICPLILEPHDFHGLSYIIELDGILHMVGYFFDNYSRLNRKHIEEFESLYHLNMSLMGWKSTDLDAKLFLFIISNSLDDLKLSKGIKQYLDRICFLNYSTLKYSGPPFFHLTEIDENGEPIYFY